MYNPFNLHEKTILVTGASSGIGRVAAIECSKMGARVVVTGRSRERLQQTYEALEGNGHLQYPADLTSDEEREELVDKLPLLQGCINNAGIEEPKPVWFLKKADLEQTFQINTHVPVLLTQLLVKKKLLGKGASVVFTSSVAGVYCAAMGSSLYAASKGALNGFVKGAALDLAAKGIRVNCVNPGMVSTDMLKEVMTEELLTEELMHYPLKRLGTPQDIAYAMVYLLSDASAWVTGTNLVIDGGFILQ